MTREELSKAIETGNYKDASFTNYSDDVQVKIGDELVRIGKNGRAYYCICVNVSDNAMLAVRRKALENAIAEKKGELGELESALKELGDENV